MAVRVSPADGGAVMKAKFDRAYSALEFLLQHLLDPTPVHYELAMAHLDGKLPDMSREIRTLTEGGLRLSQQDAAGLFSRYIGREQGVACGDPHAAQTGARPDVGGASTQGVAPPSHVVGSPAGSRDPMEDRMTRAEQDIAGLVRDLAQLRRQLSGPAIPENPELEDMAEDEGHDVLTEATSRKAADVFLQSLAAEPHGYTLALSKLDDLYRINDLYGRSVGDNVLRAMASTLRQSCEGHELIRWAGDEFLTIFRGVPLSAARAMIQDARESMRARTLKLRGAGTPIGVVTFSVGMAAGCMQDPEESIRRAKQLALSAIGSGGNQVLS